MLIKKEEWGIITHSSSLKSEYNLLFFDEFIVVMKYNFPINLKLEKCTFRNTLQTYPGLLLSLDI